MTVRSRRTLAVGMSVVVAALAAGCGGGGGAATSTSAAAGAAATVDTTATTGGTSAADVEMLIGVIAPTSLSGAGTSESIAGLEEFGPPKDLFKQRVADTGSSTPDQNGAVAKGATNPANPGAAVPSGTSTTPGAGAPAPTAGTVAPKLQATFDVAGDTVVTGVGDVVPPDTGDLSVTAIGRASVVLTLKSGLLPDGSDQLTLQLGNSITLRNQSTGQTFAVTLVRVTTTQ